jgi:hypothetical protein
LNGSSLSYRTDYTLPGYAQTVKLGDIDGDGLADIVCFVPGANRVSVFRNTSSNGNISFGTRVDLNAVGTAYSGVLVDVDKDGKLDIVYSNNNSASISIYKNVSSPGNISSASFSSRIDFSTGASPMHLATADLDGNGYPEIIVGHSSGSTVYIFRHNGTSFGTGMYTLFTMTSATGPMFVNTTDMDGDGKTDLLVSNYNSSSLYAFRNNFSGGTFTASSFNSAVSLSAPSGPSFTSFADMDGDNKLDIVLVTNTGALSLFRNTSTSGSLSFNARYDASTGNSSFGMMETPDLDNDGKPDVVASNPGNASVFAWENTIPSFATDVIAYGPYCTGTGINVPFTAPTGAFGIGNIFTAQLSDSAGSFGTPVNIGSLVRSNSGTIVATLPSSAVSSQSYRIRVISSSPAAVATDNGSAIYITACPVISSISPVAAARGATLTISGSNFSATPASNSVWFGSVRGTVTSAAGNQLLVTVPAGAIPGPVTVRVDNFTSASQQMFIPTFSGTTSVTSSSLATRADIVTSVSGVRNALAADYNNDGKPDLNASVSNANTLQVYTNQSTPGTLNATSFSTGTGLTTGAQPWGQVSADFDSDGLLDIATVNSTANTISLYRNTSAAGISFAGKVDFALPSSATPYGIAAGDIDGDGLVDIAVADLGTNSISVFRNVSSTGNINFSSRTEFTTATQPASILIAEIDGDGKPDICVTNFGSNNVSVFRNSATSGVIGSTSFAGRQDFSTGTAPFYMTCGDIDGDGKIDLITPNFSSGSVSVLRNTSTAGTVNFASKADFTTGSNPSSATVGDIDGDSKLDLVVTNQGGTGSISVLENTSTSGTVSFATKVDFTTQTSPMMPTVCDFDGDGRNDITVANNGANSISVFRNSSLAPQPTTQASNLSISGITATSMHLTWTNGNGASRIVVARTGAAVNNPPVDETGYTASSAFGSGSLTGTGNYVVYSGTGNSVTVTGLSLTTPYYFAVYEFNGTQGASNYLLTTPATNNATTLPVELASFTVVAKNRTAILSWRTASEVNNLGFEVERSVNAKDWEQITFVNGQGNSSAPVNYSYADPVSQFADGTTLYYRLVQTDFDGRSETLPVRAVTIGNMAAAPVQVFPNPAADFMIISTVTQTEGSFTITDMMGAVVMAGELNGDQTLVNTNNLRPGVYHVRVQAGLETGNIKVVKE